MKKLLTISLLLLYATFSVGLNILVHTCGGESEAMLAATNVEDPCGCGDAAAAEKCCTTVLTTMQLDDTQKASITTIGEQLSLSGTLPLCISPVPLFQDSEFTLCFLSSLSPSPPGDGQSLNSVFLI